MLERSRSCAAARQDKGARGFAVAPPVRPLHAAPASKTMLPGNKDAPSPYPIRTYANKNAQAAMPRRKASRPNPFCVSHAYIRTYANKNARAAVPQGKTKWALRGVRQMQSIRKGCNGHRSSAVNVNRRHLRRSPNRCPRGLCQNPCRPHEQDLRKREWKECASDNIATRQNILSELCVSLS
jgi:hypothetical protein